MKLSHVTGHAPEKRKYGKDVKVSVNNRLIGIEFEIEGFKLHSINYTDFSLLEFKSDGSLRDNGVEIVTLPVLGEDIVLALQELKQVLSTCTSTPYCSARCGLHVHVDMRDCTTEQLLKVLCVYSIMEALLLDYCGDNRGDNPYCVPLVDCLAENPVYKHLFYPKKEYIQNGLQGTKKYTALNILPLNALGTIEFRLHKGTLDIEEVLQWVNMLLNLVNYAVTTEKDVQQITDSVCSDSVQLLKDVFKEVGISSVYGRKTEVFKGMVRGARQFQEVKVFADIEQENKTQKEDSIKPDIRATDMWRAIQQQRPRPLVVDDPEEDSEEPEEFFEEHDDDLDSLQNNEEETF